tara:strand:- start:356 stop:520 length:165 start_codon:yes stop_codon:yes gene_type:complete
MKLKTISTILLVFGVTIIFKAYRGEIRKPDEMVGWVSVVSGIGFGLIADKYPHI